MKPESYADYVYFVYVGNNATYGFRNYTDKETGHERGYVMSYDKNQQPEYKEWVFDNGSRRQIRVHKDQRDKQRNERFPNGQLAADFLRNSPECYKSPSGTYSPIGDGEQKQHLVYFREVNESADAKIALDSRTLVLDAQMKAMKLKGEELSDMCSLISVFSTDEEILTLRLLDYAANKPSLFIKLYEDPARKVRALIRKALNATVLSQDGRMIKWEGKLVGADEDDAVSNLIKDEKLKKAIELNLNKFGL